MPTELDLQLAKFLRTMRGSEPRASFARRVKMAESYLSDLEDARSTATLTKVYWILKGLHCTINDIFGASQLPAVAESPARYQAKPRPGKRGKTS